ncbi:hypothetical protein IAQ61_007482 [Plenodomus lingam]|uniref:Uncharacterized protein n=1 Tax=Leptosphaeria maculans (strain JN3 / isolate v23.1.3 / race Av1-4-5-6-7-8) TaxID=985895 RepID=E5A5L0_LEPMJ|nr:hypothetical protein LEMA_P081470.1 [Plenodomus lingam JN3]KAH9866893.1 hypothetical protein IAQ61_007482 [Plenodomus lingam]CBX98908.1 hypothetical protein LEMA_P081470.1 [Plenodomus lingam JN3]
MAVVASGPQTVQEPLASAPNTAPAPASTGNHNLDTLQSMLNLIFIQSGRFIKEHQAGGGTGRMKLGMQRTVPIAAERFHDALDELENEVRLAQTVLRRDLALIKEDRKKRDAAAKQVEAERARLAIEAKNAPVVTPESPSQPEKVATPPEPEMVTESTPAPVAKADEPEPTSLNREEEHVPPPIKTDGNTTPRDPLFDGTPTTANPQDNDFDFDAIFGDAMDTTGDDNPDDMMDTSGNMDFNLDDSNEGPSLLRGLEDFAKDGDDGDADQGNSMDIDLGMGDSMPTSQPNQPESNEPATASKQETAPVPAPPPAPTTAPEPTPAPKADEPKPAVEPATSQPEEEEMKDATAQEDLMATMTTDNLDDLFNMDEYENPENSSFDDAFFNFGD